MAEQKKSQFSIKRLIYNDKYLMIVSLLLAIIVWIVASLNVGTSETKTIKMNVPIKLGDEISEQLGMQYYSLQDSIEVSVKISGAKYVIGQVTENDLSVKFDTSSVNRTGVQSIPILVSNASKRLDFEISGTYPSAIDGYFDVNATKVMKLDLNFDKNQVADGYIFGKPVMSEDMIIVSGPKNYIDRIEGAVVDVVFGSDEKLTELYKGNCNIGFIGTGIEPSYFTVTSRTDTATPLKTVSVTIPVLKKADLPVSIDFVDKPAMMDNDSIKIKYSTENVYAGVLDTAEIKNAVIGTINFNQLTTGKQTFDFDVTKLNGITILDNTKSITVDITINGYSERSVAIDKSKIQIEGVPDGYRAEIEGLSSATIKVVAPKGTSVSPADLTMKCDVSEEKKTNIYPVTITIGNNTSWVYGTYNATIKLIKK